MKPVPSFALVEEAQLPEVLDMMEAFNAIDAYPFEKEIARKNLLQFIRQEHLGRLWVIKLEVVVVGYVILTFGFSFEYQGRDAFIDELYLKEVYRGKGIGKIALDFVEHQAQQLGIKAIHLEVETTNEVGNKLYLSKGFKSNHRTLLTKKLSINK